MVGGGVTAGQKRIGHSEQAHTRRGLDRNCLPIPPVETKGNFSSLSGSIDGLGFVNRQTDFI